MKYLVRGVIVNVSVEIRFLFVRLSVFVVIICYVFFFLVRSP